MGLLTSEAVYSPPPAEYPREPGEVWLYHHRKDRENVCDRVRSGDWYKAHTLFCHDARQALRAADGLSEHRLDGDIECWTWLKAPEVDATGGNVEEVIDWWARQKSVTVTRLGQKGGAG